MAEPIWKDTYYYHTGDEDTLRYRIEVSQDKSRYVENPPELITEGGVIYYGTAYRRPDGVMRIQMNDVCSNYLSSIIDSPDVLQDGNWNLPWYTRTFTIYDDSDNSFLEEFRFSNDWSYYSTLRPAIYSISDPITKKRMYGQKVLETNVMKDKATVSISTYDTVNDICGKRYNIIYVNSLGGWDNLLIEGITRRSNNYTQYETVRSHNNSKPEFGRYRYLTNWDTDWEVHTGWLKDEQAENIVDNLFNSNFIYLQDMEKDMIIPVVITNQDAEYKERRNDRGMIQYGITLSSSQTKKRR